MAVRAQWLASASSHRCSSESSGSFLFAVGDHRDDAEFAPDFVVEVLLDAMTDSQLGFFGIAVAVG